MADRDAKIDDLIRDASHLAVVTGAHVAVVAVKPDGAVRQYGCPSVDSVVGRFVGGASAQNGAPSTARNQAAVDRLVRRFLEKKRSEDASYAAGSASERELKDLQWELEVLERLRERLERDL